MLLSHYLLSCLLTPSTMRVLQSDTLGMRGSSSYYPRDLTMQRGNGIGSIFSSLYNTVVPLVKSALGVGSRVAKSQIGKQVAKSVKKRAMKAGLNVVNDALQGENVLKATKREIKKAGGSVLSDLVAPKRPKKRTAPKRGKRPKGKRGRRATLFN